MTVLSSYVRKIDSSSICGLLGVLTKSIRGIIGVELCRLGSNRDVRVAAGTAEAIYKSRKISHYNLSIHPYCTLSVAILSAAPTSVHQSWSIAFFPPSRVYIFTKSSHDDSDGCASRHMER